METDDFANQGRKSISVVLQQEIKDFIIENSTVDPNKKHCRKIDGELVPRRYLMATLIDLHSKFCTEKFKKIALSTFCKYRPEYCVAPNFNERDTCACPKHTNFQFLIDALSRVKVIKETSTHQFVKNLTCDNITRNCFERTCDDCKTKTIIYNIATHDRPKQIKYKRWINIYNEERVSGKTGKPIKVSYVKAEETQDEIGNIVALIKAETNQFLLHEMRIFHHYHETQKIMKKLEDGDEELLQFNMEFSQNYECKYNKEIQAMHYGASRQQICLHTCCLYSSEINHGCATASENLSHDACAVIAHVIKALQLYEPHMSLVKHLHFISHGVNSQYKNKSIFYLMTQVLPEFFPAIETITHHYSESNHGKSKADGYGAVIKNKGDRLVAHGTDLPDFKTFLDVLSSELKEMFLAPVTTEEIQKIESILKENQSKVRTFVGTTRVHQYTWTRSNPHVVHFNSLSCLDCPPGKKCSHFHMGSIDYNESLVVDISENEKKKKTKVIKILENKVGQKARPNSKTQQLPSTSKATVNCQINQSEAFGTVENLNPEVPDNCRR